ncbi:hypothetical protein TNCV_5019431 [Trichonephila clavipes]|nr:hypothetical protein TNCV_5019431 [Trichonephila clavipes]
MRQSDRTRQFVVGDRRRGQYIQGNDRNEYFRTIVSLLKAEIFLIEPRNFEPWSSEDDDDDSVRCDPSLSKLQHPANGRTLSLKRFNVHQPLYTPIISGTGVELIASQPRVCDHDY